MFSRNHLYLIIICLLIVIDFKPNVNNFETNQTGTTSPGQSGTEQVLHIVHSSRIRVLFPDVV